MRRERLDIIYRVHLYHLSALFRVKDVTVHPDFSRTTLHSDIAVINIIGAFQWTDYVRPVCIPSVGFQVADRAVCAIAGWGDTDVMDYQMLNYALIPVIDRQR